MTEHVRAPLEHLSDEQWRQRLTELPPDEQSFLAKWPWLDPYLYPYPHSAPDYRWRSGDHYDDHHPLKPGVTKIARHSVLAVRATHKTVPVLVGYPSDKIEQVGGQPWELFNCSLAGTIDGQDYLWGMPVLGMGLLDCCIPCYWARELTDAERDTWAKARLSMVGSHTGKLQQTGLGSGVAPR